MRIGGWGLTILVFSFLLSSLAGPARAPSGTWDLGYNTTSDTLWASTVPVHVTVTITETHAAADTYADTTASSLTVETSNKQMVLHDGESGTINDVTTSVYVSENPGYDHNGYAYYGMGGTWEVTVLDTGSGGGPGPAGGSSAGLPSWGWIAIVVVLAAVAVIVVALLAAKGRNVPANSANAPPAYNAYPPPAFSPYAPAASPPYAPPATASGAALAGVCPNCRTPFAPGGAFCAACGTRLG